MVYKMPYGFIIEADKGKDVTDYYLHHEYASVKTFLFGIYNCKYDEAKQEEILYNFFMYMMEHLSEWVSKCANVNID